MSGEEANALRQALALHSRPPPKKSFVSLSQAVSWIALRRSIRGPALSKLLGIGDPPNRDQIGQINRLDRAIKSAVETLTDLGSGGKIMFLGKKYLHVLAEDNDDRIPTERIPAEQIGDYRGFDTLNDTLFPEPYRKLKLAWGPNRREIFSPLGKHYRFVMVNRADLIREFPAEAGLHGSAFEFPVSSQRQTLARAPAVKHGRPPSDEDILVKADEMRKRDLDGYQIASTMHREPGFENVSTTAVRGLIKGRYPAGRPKKPAQ